MSSITSHSPKAPEIFNKTTPFEYAGHKIIVDFNRVSKFPWKRLQNCKRVVLQVHDNWQTISVPTAHSLAATLLKWAAFHWCHWPALKVLETPGPGSLFNSSLASSLGTCIV